MFKRIKKNKILLFLIAICCAAMIEIFGFNGINLYRMHGNNGIYNISTDKIKIEGKEKKVIKERIRNKSIFDYFNNEKENTEEPELIEENIVENIIEIDCENKYISKLRINYHSTDSSNDKDAKYVEYLTFDEYGNYKTTYDFIPFENINEKVVKNINNRISTIKIFIGNDINNINISSIEIVNEFSFNIYRFIFILFFVFSILLLYIFKDKIKTKMHFFFLVIGFGTGFLMIMFTPNLTRYSWDDKIHFDRTYQLFEQNQCETETLNYVSMAREVGVDVPESVEENQMIDKYLNNNNKCKINPNSSKNYNALTYSDFTYIPSAIVLKISKMIGIPFTIMFKMGKLMNLIIYLTIGYFTIKNAKFGKKILFVILLLPTNLFLASQYSRDAYITSLLALGISMFINCCYQKEKVSYKQLLLIILAFIFGSLPKPIYIPFIALIFLIPNSKFKDKKQAMIVKLMTFLILSMIMASLIFLNVSTANTVSDVRGGDASTRRQMQLIMSQPISFAKVFIPNFFNVVFENFISSATFLNFCTFGTIFGNIYYILLCLIIVVCMLDNENKISIKNKISFAALLFIVVSFIMGSMYLSYTPVGSTTVNGVQARYFLPLLYPFFLLFSSDKIKVKFDTYKINLFIIVIMLLILYYSIYAKFLEPFYM